MRKEWSWLAPRSKRALRVQAGHLGLTPDELWRRLVGQLRFRTRQRLEFDRRFRKLSGFLGTGGSFRVYGWSDGRTRLAETLFGAFGRPKCASTFVRAEIWPE